jgi:PKD repeat protein
MLARLRTEPRVFVAIALVGLLLVSPAVVSASGRPATNERGPAPSAPISMSVPPPIGGRGSAASPIASGLPSSASLTWTDLDLSHAPPVSESGGMVYDSTDGYVVMFGGRDFTDYGIIYYNSTWKFDNGTWTNITTPIHPSGRLGFMLADDPADHAVILFGGQSRSTTYLNDTWEFHAGVWTNITHGVAPPGRFWGGMSYDSSLNEVLLFGGQQGLYPAAKEYTNDTWAFHAGIWTQLDPATSPAGRDGVQLADDIADHEVVAFGGLDFVNDLNDTWTYANGTWSNATAGLRPDPRTGVGIAYDAAAQDVVMYGGFPANSYYYSTWLFHAGTWTQYNLTPTPPSGTIWNQMTYDAADHEVLLLEDDGSGNATWELNVTSSTSTPLSVQASASPVTGSAPLNVTFTASASGGTPPYAYHWSFGDGASNGSAADFHVYSTPGYYDAVLNVTDAADATASENWTIQVNTTTGPPLSVVANAAPLTGATPLVVNFSAEASGGTAPYAFLWQFGDGATGLSQNTSHTYPTAGAYSANLTVTDHVGATKVDHWTVVPTTVTGAPLAIEAQETPLSGGAPLVVSFTSTASGGTAPYSFLWEFGDGTSSANQNTTHTFSAAGSYPGTLTVTDHAGATQSASWTVVVVAPLSVTATADPTSALVGQSVSFHATAAGGVAPYTYTWAFGEGGTGAGQNTTNAFAGTGIFVVYVTAKDANGAIASASVTVDVRAAGSSPSSTFSSSDWWILLVFVLAAVVVLVVYLQRRRRRPPAATSGPSGAPPPPPS